MLEDRPSGRFGEGSSGLKPAWLKRWAELVKLPPAQARTAALLVAAAAVGIGLMGLPDLMGQQPDRTGTGKGLVTPGAPGAAPAAAVAPAVPEAPGYAQEVERELEAILGLMDGVGSVKVMITWDQASEQVIAYNETVDERASPPGLPGEGAPRSTPSSPASERREERQAVIIRDADGRREGPIVLTERYPKVRGVVVVADGARDPRTRLAIQRAVSAALGVAPYRIHVQAKRR